MERDVYEARLLSAELLGQSDTFPGGDEAVVVYAIGDWRVDVRSSVYAPSGDFETLTIKPVGYPEKYSTPDSGVTYALMRSIPLQKARVQIDRLKSEAWRLNGDHVGGSVRVPERMKTEIDWLQFVRLYASYVDRGERHPSQRLADVTGFSKETINTRLRRAREKGLLERPKGGELGSLTPKAQAALKMLDSGANS